MQFRSSSSTNIYKNYPQLILTKINHLLNNLCIKSREIWNVYYYFIFLVSCIMSSRSYYHTNNQVSGNKATEHSKSYSRTSYCDSWCSEKQNKQRKLANRSPASRGYPAECMGNYLSNTVMLWWSILRVFFCHYTLDDSNNLSTIKVRLKWNPALQHLVIMVTFSSHETHLPVHFL